MPGWLPRPRLITVLAAAIAVAAGAAGTALALGGSGSPQVAAMARGSLTRAELKVTSGTAILDVSVGRLGATLLRVSAPDGKSKGKQQKEGLLGAGLMLGVVKLLATALKPTITQYVAKKMSGYAAGGGPRRR